MDEIARQQIRKRETLLLEIGVLFVWWQLLACNLLEGKSVVLHVSHPESTIFTIDLYEDDFVHDHVAQYYCSFVDRRRLPHEELPFLLIVEVFVVRTEDSLLESLQSVGIHCDRTNLGAVGDRAKIIPVQLN